MKRRRFLRIRYVVVVILVLWSLLQWKIKPEPEVGQQYTLTLRKQNGKVKTPLAHLTTVSLANLPDIRPSDFESFAGDKSLLLSTLRAAGIQQLDADVERLLPDRERLSHLYGTESPLVLGQETCEAYRDTVPAFQRYVGVAGLFNTGTTALTTYLEANLLVPNSVYNWDDRPPDHRYEVPWGKHRLYSIRDMFPLEGFTPGDYDKVLPIVVVRDPLVWMQSMCSATYTMRWRHTEAHCPNLVANEADVQHFQGLQLQQIIPAHIPKQNVKSTSLLDMWVKWYQEYRDSEQPHLIVRHEDLLWNPKAVLEAIRDCVGGTFKSESFVYLVGQSKWFHNHIKAQTGMISGMIKYGSGATRLRNLTQFDLQYARGVLLQSRLMNDFHYRTP